jgi:hypothetical protein
VAKEYDMNTWMPIDLSLFDRLEGFTTAFVAVMFPVLTIAVLL